MTSDTSTTDIKPATVPGRTSTGATSPVGPIGDKATQAFGAARDAVGPLTDKARGFAKQRPFAAAALAGVVGIAILNTLRGRR
ncbi:MAG: CsbD family protein [Sphingomonas bacterium]|jgi:hypothetical protein|nr:hypothetical protein [Sphingomonas bacterium]MDB5690525.1 CsbD family protein [Sphingomonas bacterium]